jgi:pseudouridine-5'-phosphate glycosidase
MSNVELLTTMWETVKEYISSKDRQAAADHVITELIEIGIDDDELEQLAVDKPMLNAIKAHIDVTDADDIDEE